MVFKEGKKFVAYSPFLDLSSCGDDFDEAKNTFTDSAKLFVEELIRKGTLDKCLRSLGWSKVKKQWTSPTVVSQDSIPIKVEKIPVYA